MQFKPTLKSSPSLIDLTPLVDVIFLLLIFFIVTSDILPLKSLKIQNPELSRDAEPLTSQIVVVMDAQHVIYVGSRKTIVGMEGLKQQLKDEVAKLQKLHAGIHPTVVLSIDRRVDYATFLKIFAVVQEVTPQVRLVYRYVET